MAMTLLEGRSGAVGLGSQRIESMVEMNTTPLIDVMLVLLIMFIITIPAQTDAVKVDIPNGPTPIVRSISNELALTADGQAYWNGWAIDDRMLRSALARSATMDPAPELHFRPDAATSYARVDQVLAMTAQAKVGKFGFVGNQQYRDAF